MFITCVPGAFRGQKRASDALELELQLQDSIQVLEIEPPHPLQDHQALLSKEPSFQPWVVSYLLGFSFLSHAFQEK